jgi:hypothetical protein
MRAPLIAAALVLLTGCGQAAVVDDAPSVGDAYDGPLDLPVSHADSAGVLERSGSAGRALECSGRPANGGGADYDSGLASVQDDPAAAVEDWMDEEGGWFGGLPQEGYRREREDDGRVLYSLDVDGHTKAAVVVSDSRHDYNDHTGWGVEAWAVCDPSELPAELTDAMGIQVWEDGSGRRVPTTTVTSFPGAEHCDWQDITFLRLGAGAHAAQFVSDDGGELGDLLQGRYDGSAALPDDASDTGFRHDGRELWLADDESAAYLVSLADPDDVQRWPLAREPILCM